MFKALKIGCLFACVFFSNAGRTNSFSFITGYYDLQAEVSGEGGALADFGSLRTQYWHSLNNLFSFSIGYTVLLEKYGAGDSAYGFDLGGIFRPFNNQYGSFSGSGGVSISVKQKWNPFIGIGFHQRQYQSVRSSYSGLGLSLGNEYDIGEDFLLYGDIRYVNLSGPVDASATELSVNFGVSYLL